MAETDIPTTYKQIVRFGLDKDGFFGLICSSDNGKTIKLIVGPDGLVLHPEDGDKIWNLIESKVQLAIDTSGSKLSWSKISDKPDLALRSDLPDFNQFALKKDLPAPVDLSGYALKSELPSLSGYAKLTDIPSVAGLVKEAELDSYAKKSDLPDVSGLAKSATVDAVKTTAESALSNAEKAQSTADANSKALADKADKSEIPDISGLAKKSDIPAPVDLSGYAKTDVVDAVKTVADKAQAIADTNSKLLETKADRKDLPTVPTDLVHSAELDQVRTDVSQAKQDSAKALAAAKSANTTLDASNEFVDKKPSEYQIGFSHEEKAAGVLGVTQTALGKNLTYSTAGLLTSVAIDSYGSRCVRQRFEVIDSDYPYTFERTGTGNVWYQWHGVTVWD